MLDNGVWWESALTKEDAGLKEVFERWSVLLHIALVVVEWAFVTKAGKIL